MIVDHFLNKMHESRHSLVQESSSLVSVPIPEWMDVSPTIETTSLFHLLKSRTM